MKKDPLYVVPALFRAKEDELDWLIREAKTLLKENENRMKAIERRAKTLDRLIEQCQDTLKSIGEHQTLMYREFRKNKRLYEKKFLEQAKEALLLQEAKKSTLSVIAEMNHYLCQERLANMETINKSAS